MYEEIKNRVIAEAKARMVEVYRPSIEELGNMHKATINLYKAALKNIQSSCIDENGNIVKAPDLKDLDAIWKVVKTEKGEATNVSAEIPTLEDDKKAFLDSVLDEEDDE
jgi:hypothetical protein